MIKTKTVCLFFLLKARGSWKPRLFKKGNRKDLISCIAFPSPLHDLLQALWGSDRDKWVGCWCLLSGRKCCSTRARLSKLSSSPSFSPVAPALLSGNVSPSPAADAQPPRGLWPQPPPSGKRNDSKYAFYTQITHIPNPGLQRHWDVGYVIKYSYWKRKKQTVLKSKLIENT